MSVLIIVATELELKPLLAVQFPRSWKLEFWVSGIGLLVSGVRISQKLARGGYDLVLQMGVAGSFDVQRYPLGSLVVVGREYVAQLGLWQGRDFQDIFQMGLQDCCCEFQPRYLLNPYAKQLEELLPVVNGISVSTISTIPEHIRYYTRVHAAEVESMEGAALHYVCSMLGLRFFQIRAISNRVGDRDKGNWQLELGLSNLAEFLRNHLGDCFAS